MRKAGGTESIKTSSGKKDSTRKLLSSGAGSKSTLHYTCTTTKTRSRRKRSTPPVIATMKLTSLRPISLHQLVSKIRRIRINCPTQKKLRIKIPNKVTWDQWDPCATFSEAAIKTLRRQRITWKISLKIRRMNTSTEDSCSNKTRIKMKCLLILFKKSLWTRSSN